MLSPHTGKNEGDPPVNPPDRSPQSGIDRQYGRRVSGVALGFGAIAAIGGIVTLIAQASSSDSLQDMKALLFAPFTFGIAGWCLGFSLALLFAPRVYLQGDDGKKWLAVVGTESIPVARMACALFVVFALVFFGVLIWASATGQF